MERPLLAVPPMVNRPLAEEYRVAAFQKVRPVDDAGYIVDREIITLGLQF